MATNEASLCVANGFSLGVDFIQQKNPSASGTGLSLCGFDFLSPKSAQAKAYATNHQSLITRKRRLRICVIVPLLALRPRIECFPALGSRHAAARLNASRDMPRRRRRQLHKFPARPFERKAMFVIAPRRIRSQRRNASTICNFHCFRAPLFRRTVTLRRHPPLDVPAIVRQIFRLAPQLDRFAQQISIRVAILPLPANPIQPRPSPHRPVIRLAKSIAPTREQQFPRDVRRRFMRFSKDANQSEFGGTGFSLCAP